MPRLRALSLPVLLRLGLSLLLPRLRALSWIMMLLPLRLARLRGRRRLVALRSLRLRLSRLLVRRRLVALRCLRLPRLRLLVRRLRGLSLRCRTLATAPLVLVRAILVVRARGANSNGNDKCCA